MNKNNNFQEEINYLDSIKPEERRSAFLKYCKEKIELEEEKKISIGEASNRICGACNVYFKEIMPEFSEIMDIACDLEIPDAYRNRPLDDWNHLKKIIDKVK